MKLFSVSFSLNRYHTLKTVMKATEKEVFVQAPWGKVAALTWGESSSPPVVLCHGKQDVCSGFRPLVNLLPRRFFYVSIELPGNGKSEQFPKGARYTTADIVPAVTAVKNHFKWENFMYIGHSLGVVVGKYFNFAYPGVITRFVELDPVPAYDAWTPNNFDSWYHLFYGNYYKEDKYNKYNSGTKTAPKYTYEKCVELMRLSRRFEKDVAEHILERAVEPAGDGLYRFTHDQRQREITRMPLSPDFMRELYTSVKTPTFAILATDMVELGLYNLTPFILDPKSWPNKNFKVRVVKGSHDVHIINPECMAEDISNFLLEDFKAKL